MACGQQCSLATGGIALRLLLSNTIVTRDVQMAHSVQNNVIPCLNNAHQLAVDAEQCAFHAAQEQAGLQPVCSGSLTLAYQCRPFASVCHLIVEILPLMNTDEGCL